MVKYRENGKGWCNNIVVEGGLGEVVNKTFGRYATQSKFPVLVFFGLKLGPPEQIAEICFALSGAKILPTDEN